MWYTSFAFLLEINDLSISFCCLLLQFWWISLERQECEPNDGFTLFCWISWNLCNDLSISSSCLQAQFWWISLPRQDCENDGVNSVLWISWNICHPLSIPSACNWDFDCYSWRQQSGQAICFDLPEKNVDRMLRFALFCWILVDGLQSFNLLSLQLQLWMICLKTTICSALCFNPSDENVN